ncbi:MAG: ABC transporter permease [Bacteroidales bacterium]|nr:ABC transporter permease [Bacteroidales bacterium]
MIKNYLKIAYRNIVGNKFYSAINIIGLSIGIVCTIFILLYITDELSYDKHHVNHERIYRIESDFNIANKQDRFAVTAIPWGPVLKNECPEVAGFVRFMKNDDVLLKYEEKEFFEEDIYFADSSIFDVFTHTFLFGNPKTALNEPNTIVLTKKLANKYFRNKNPIGEILKTGEGTNLKVTGVIENVPGNSHLKFKGLISVETVAKMTGEEKFNSTEPGTFWNIRVFTYIILNKNSKIESVQEKIPQLYDKYMASIGNQINASFDMMFTQLAELHFRSFIEADLPRGNMAYIYIFAVVAVFILIIASINYMNMATAQSANRAKEVGLRKVMGARKKQLIGQFISESIVLSLIGLIIALFLVYMLLPVFNELSGKSLDLSFMTDPVMLLSILFISAFIGLVSGSYPAFYLSSFIPVKVLKQNTKSGGKGWLRKVLVVFQFCISTIMIIGTIIVSGQLNFLKNKDLGFDKKDVVVLEVRDSAFASKIPSFEEELIQSPYILKTATSTNVPGAVSSIIVFRVEKEEKMQEYAINLFFIDHDYLDMMNIEIVKGRNYDKKMGTDLLQGFIINETAAKKLGWGENAIGKRMQFGIDVDGSARRDGKVIGVVKDFHYVPLNNEIEPIVLMLGEFPNKLVSVKIDKNNKTQAVDYIQDLWTKYDHHYPFDYYYLENELSSSYDSEENLGRIFMYFAIIAIFISCLGLFGLSSYITEQRTKEIGIRKVLGSTVSGIITLLSKEFLVLIIIANVLAWPIAYFVIHKWLQNFAYSISINWFIFLITTIFTIILALTITGIKAFISARANPVETLKYE